MRLVQRGSAAETKLLQCGTLLGGNEIAAQIRTFSAGSAAARRSPSKLGTTGTRVELESVSGPGNPNTTPSVSEISCGNVRTQNCLTRDYTLLSLLVVRADRRASATSALA